MTEFFNSYIVLDSCLLEGQYYCSGGLFAFKVLLFSVWEACTRATMVFSLYLWLRSSCSACTILCLVFEALFANLSCSTEKRVKWVNLQALSVVLIVSWELVCPLCASRIWSSQLFVTFSFSSPFCLPEIPEILPSKIDTEMQVILKWSEFIHKSLQTFY